MTLRVIEDLTEEERYLLAILQDQSGVDQAEFLWTDETAKDGVFRAYDFQVPWYRDNSKTQIDQCGRSVGKSTGIQMRAFVFPFCNPSETMLLTAPEMIHLDPVTNAVEDRILSVRLSREMLRRSGTSNGITHRPFEAKFANGSRILGRIPQKDGKGVKGMHPLRLEMDEAQDYPEPGWIELFETLKYGNEQSQWRAHGVSRGVRDRYYKQSQPGSGWKVHRYTAMHRPDWTPEEREAKAELYGSRDHPDFRRNILGLHGDATSALFVLTRLMACVDSNQSSDYNANEYYSVRLDDERLADTGLSTEDALATLISFPLRHVGYERFWAGMDVGMTNHPTEILVFAEVASKMTGAPKVTEDGVVPDVRLKLLTRLHLQRISAPDQRAVLEMVWDFYRPEAMAMDRTGLGLPIYQEVLNRSRTGLARAIRGYNFSEKIVVGHEPLDDDDLYGEPEPITANVLEYSSDQMRLLVDKRILWLPWDIDLLREFQGQTYVVKRSTTNPYGKKEFNQGKFHTLDAARMAALARAQASIEAMDAASAFSEPVFDRFVPLWVG
jgi:hypothetical protein